MSLAMHPSVGAPSNPFNKSSCAVFKVDNRSSDLVKLDAQEGSEGYWTKSETCSACIFVPYSSISTGSTNATKAKNKKSKQSSQGASQQAVYSKQGAPQRGASQHCASSGSPLQFRLSSKADVFVPGCPASHAAPARKSGMIPVHSAIKGAFDGCLGSISMKVRPPYTEVGVTVHATPSDMCGMDPILALVQARSYAMYTLMHAFQLLGPQINFLEASADESQLQFKFCGSSPDLLCPEFCQYGQCSQPQTCCWEHVALEHFIITLVMKPSSEDALQVAMPALVGTVANKMIGYPMITPMPPTINQISGTVYVPGAVMPSHESIGPDCLPIMWSGHQVLPRCRGDSEQADSTAAGSSEHSGSLSPAELLSPCDTPRLRANSVRWADIDFDEDDCADPVCWPDTDNDEDA